MKTSQKILKYKSRLMLKYGWLYDLMKTNQKILK